MKLLDKILPIEDDPTLTPEQRERRERERKHFIFAFMLVLGCMLMLPISGAVYVLLIRFGVIASPF